MPKQSNQTYKTITKIIINIIIIMKQTFQWLWDKIDERIINLYKIVLAQV